METAETWRAVWWERDRLQRIGGPTGKRCTVLVQGVNMNRYLALICGFLGGCGASISDEEVVAAAKEASAELPTGQVGLELLGKAVWLQASNFDKSCLEEKNLAFNDDPAARPGGPAAEPRISPTYAAQWYLTASTESGLCVDLGSDLTVSFGEILGVEGGKRVEVILGMEKPTPWFSCLEKSFLTRLATVTPSDDGTPVVDVKWGLGDDNCPKPLPSAQERLSRKRQPSAKPPKAPGKSDVLAAAKTLDDALYAGDFNAVLGATSCYNLFEKTKYGTCAVSEVLGVGPLPRGGEERAQDGTPWLEYLVNDISSVGDAVRDGADPSLFHVPIARRKSGRKGRASKPKSFSVQWAQGAWKVVGIVEIQGEGLTNVRYVTDLIRSEQRDIFSRRLAGEEIDYRGFPLNPEAEGADGASGGSEVNMGGGAVVSGR